MFLVSHFALSAGTCTWLRRERKGGLMRNTSGEMISGGGARYGWFMDESGIHCLLFLVKKSVLHGLVLVMFPWVLLFFFPCL